jgi:PAS domain-containing protein
MVWRSAAVVQLGPDGRYVDADEVALELLGAANVEELRDTAPDTFQVEPQDPAATEAFQRAMVDARFQGLLGEIAFRRLDGDLVRVRTAIIPEAEGGYRALMYPVERPTTNLTPRIYKIADVLAEWRTAERKLVDVDPESDEGRRLGADVELLRQQYQQLFHRTIGGHA